MVARGSVGGGRFGFSPPTRGALTRKCPRCQAKPGWSCGRWTTLGIWKTMSKTHAER